jgi:hypothetical protein
MADGEESQSAVQPTQVGVSDVAPLQVTSVSSASIPAVSEYPEVDALKILLQASAAAESLQLRFAELHQRRAELLGDQRQLEAERSAFEQRAAEFAAEVARARAEQREQSAELQQRLQRCAQQEEQ